jgi:2-dehydropantoate 2-reductase
MNNRVTSKHWFIAGHGSIGSFVAYNALLSDIKCDQIVRDANNSKAALFHPIGKQPTALPTPITSVDLTLNSIHYLIVPLKAYDIVPFLQQIMPYLADDAAIILCHNGLGTIEPVTDLLTKNMNLFFCTTSNGLYKNKDGIFQAGLGESQWSHVAGNTPEKLSNDDLVPLFVRITQVDNLQKILWQKLIVNCVINPLTALHNVKNGALAQKGYAENIECIIKETLLVANKVGISLEFQTMLNTVNQVIANTAENYSSMNQDVKSHKQTEIDFISGYVIKEGLKLNIPTPVCQSLYDQIKAL